MYNFIVDIVFGKCLELDSAAEYSERAILCPVDALNLNEDVLERLDGEARTYFSTDEAISITDEDLCEYAPEVLYSLIPSGMVPHKLNIKPGYIIMILRNLEPKAGICNGTRMVVPKATNRVPVCKILPGNQSCAIG